MYSISLTYYFRAAFLVDNFSREVKFVSRNIASFRGRRSSGSCLGVYTEEKNHYSGIEGSREECHDLNREKIEEIEIQSLLFFRQILVK